MTVDFIDEPELEFGVGRHLDVRFGLTNYFPFDVNADGSARVIRIGVIGTSTTIEGLLTWLEKCSEGVPQKETNKSNLFPQFPGFSADSCFRCEIKTEARIQVTLLSQEVDELTAADSPADVVRQSVALFAEKVDRLTETGGVDVVMIAPPVQLLDAMVPDESPEEQDASPPKAGDDGDDEGGEESSDVRIPDFRDLLKARVMASGKPVQVVLPSTYGGKKSRHQGALKRPKKLQDEATRAWNFFTALYYKAGGTPWRLPRDASALTSCFVGVSFFRTIDDKSVWSSVAQIFDERGDGVIVRGGKAIKEDRRPALATDDARNILRDALTRYREIHRHSPARVVLHKTSRYTSDEVEGFSAALSEERVDVVDMLNVSKFAPRVYRNGAYPPLRGTMLSLSDAEHLLYTRGGVDFYETYTGLYVPRPFFFLAHKTESTPRQLATELLALTKMNWNSSQFDHRDPITVKAAREVGAVLKHLSETDRVFPRYSFYM